jgi:DNA-binding CsgD family transcriptional regulator
LAYTGAAGFLLLAYITVARYIFFNSGSVSNQPLGIMNKQFPNTLYNQFTEYQTKILQLIVKDYSNCQFTEREKEILQLIVEGHSNSKISEFLYITVNTVNKHTYSILNKLDGGSSQSIGAVVPRKPRPDSDGNAAEELSF